MTDYFNYQLASYRGATLSVPPTYSSFQVDKVQAFRLEGVGSRE